MAEKTLKELLAAGQFDETPMRLHLDPGLDAAYSRERRGRSGMHVVNDPDLIPAPRPAIGPNVVRTEPEYRQVAKTILVPSHLVAHVNWNSIGQMARELGSDWDVAHDGAGDCLVTFFWRYAEGEIDAQRANGGR